MPTASSHDVLTFWFAPGQSERWYAKNEAFDAEIRLRFLPTYEAACSGDLDAWRDGPESLLALIIVLDQFPRNMFRGEARAFASDPQAVRYAKEGIDKGFVRALGRTERLDFFYMPLMHSETLTDHDLLRQRHGDNPYALQHREIIERFGRYPHRNAVLGRANTAEEASYLADPHMPF